MIKMKAIIISILFTATLFNPINAADNNSADNDRAATKEAAPKYITTDGIPSLYKNNDTIQVIDSPKTRQQLIKKLEKERNTKSTIDGRNLSSD